jgi:hypothetical protein
MWAGASLPMAQTPAMPERNGQARGVAARPPRAPQYHAQQNPGLDLGAAVQGLLVVLQVGVRHGTRGEVGTKPSQGLLAHLPIE